MNNLVECTDLTSQVSALRDQLGIPSTFKYGSLYYQVYSPQVLIFQDPEGVATQATGIIEANLVDSPDSQTYPTGESWKLVYKKMEQRKAVFSPLLSKRKSACVDEYVMRDNNPNYGAISYVVYTDERIGRPLGLGSEHWVRPEGTTDDPYAAARIFEAELKGLKMRQINLGIGPDPKRKSGEFIDPKLSDLEIEEMVKRGEAIAGSKHIGFIEAGTPPSQGATVVNLDEGTIFANSRDVPAPDKFPRQAITQSHGDILRAGLRVLIATGRFKQRNIETVLLQPPTIDNPSSLVTLGETIFLLDADAAQRVVDRLKHAELICYNT